MTLALFLILIGLMLIYGGIKGYSITSMLVGKTGVPSSKPQPVQRGTGQ